MNEPKETASPLVQERRPLPFSLSLFLFLLTLFTTSVAGVQWIGKDPYELRNLAYGLEYSLAILFVLASHEFGHFLAARFHDVKTTYPFFIPFPPLPFLLNFGTLGAIIRLKEVVPSRKAMFDIGVAGPLAGFLACVAVLVLGFQTLPGPEYLVQIHSDFDFTLNAVPNSQGLPLEFGQTLFFAFMKFSFADPALQFVPPMSEIYHYPLLCVGWFGLFVTAMNLIPIGQFDGGHILYTMFGEKQRIVARIAFSALLILGAPSLIESLIRFALPTLGHDHTAPIIPFSQYSWSGWFLWAMISYYFVKLDHPPIPDETPLNNIRKTLGWITIVIFVLSFSFTPFSIAL